MAQSRSSDLDDLFTYFDSSSNGLDLLPGEEKTRKRELELILPKEGSTIHKKEKKWD